MNLKDLQRIFQVIAKNVRCPHCGRQFNFENIHIESLSESICFLRLDCWENLPLFIVVGINGQNFNIKNEKISNNDLIFAYKKINKIKNISELFE